MPAELERGLLRVRPGSFRAARFLAFRFRSAISLLCLLGGLAALSACRPGAPAGADPNRLQVVVSTTILADVVRQVGGDAVQVTALLPSGTDPHAFNPSPQDLIRVADADLVFINGAGLETFLDRLVENAANSPSGAAGTASPPVISVSEGLDLRSLQSGQGHQDASPAGAEFDPHVWFDPANVRHWVKRVQDELSAVDPAHAASYAANAQAYLVEVEQLEGWIQEQVSQIPPEKRLLVSDHQNLGYFADRYGFRQVGAIIPSVSASAAPSAEEMAALQDAIRELGAPAIFVGTTVSPDLARRVAADTGTQVVPLYTDSLTPAGGEAASYIELMRFDVGAIVEALR